MLRRSNSSDKWGVVVDGEVVHTAPSEEAARRWAAQNGIVPDNIAPVPRLLHLLPNWRRKIPRM